ncbi:MAG: alpha/beta hydrolase [Deltaproteobacteria bacterium]|nr:alpha/beta hydrolase [Deltaproteobacteria bacterium]
MSANPSSHPIVHTVNTQDQWTLSLYRYPGDLKKTRYPVLLVHGLASNRFNLDFPDEDLNLAKFLHQAGFDTWIVDLRGAGASKTKLAHQQQWNFDDYVLRDLPAVAKKIRQVTGKKQFHWIGHSLGGVMAYAYIQQINPKDLKSLTTIATPVTTSRKIGYIRYTFELDRIIKYLPHMPYRFMSKIAKLFTEQILNHPQQIVISKENMTPALLEKLLKYGVENVPTALVLQIHDWFRHGHFKSADRKVDYMGSLKKFTMPILMVAGTQDSFTDPDEVKKILAQFPSKNKKILVFGKKFGHRVDYGHIDLVLGLHSKKEVFPAILRWLKKQD